MARAVLLVKENSRRAAIRIARSILAAAHADKWKTSINSDPYHSKKVETSLNAD
jgi:hypothetical protein